MQTHQKSTSSLLIGLLLLLGAALIFAAAFATGLAASLPLMSGKLIEARGTILGVIFGFESLLLLAAAYFCLQKYMERPQADSPIQFRLKLWHVIALIIGTGVALSIGYFAAESRTLNWLILPILTIPAVMLPIVLFFAFGAGRIPLGPRWRAWGILGLGMTLGPLILAVVEIMMLFVIVIIAAIFLAAQPGIPEEMRQFAEQINSLQNDQQALLNLFIPYLLKPGVIIPALLFLGIIVPFTEELVKPIGVWFFAGKLESPAQGFALGALSGAAYALIETFGSSAQTVAWAALLFSRIGTALLHITTTGLMGWGIALAWQKRQYARFFLIYLISSTLHGLWNTSVVAYSFLNLSAQSSTPNPLNNLAPYMLAAAIGVAAILLAILLTTNARLSGTDKVNEPQTDGKIQT